MHRVRCIDGCHHRTRLRRWWSWEHSLGWLFTAVIVVSVIALFVTRLRWRWWWREEFTDRQIHLDDSVVSTTQKEGYKFIERHCLILWTRLVSIAYFSYGYFESISSTMVWKRHGMSVKLPHFVKCLSVKASMAVKAKRVTSLIWDFGGRSVIWKETQWKTKSI